MSGIGISTWTANPERHTARTRHADTLRAVRQGYCALVLLSAFIQVLFFWNTEDNLISTLLALISSLLGISYALNSHRFRGLPVSALILLLYTTTATSGALLVKTLEWSPLSERLQMPETTFLVLLVTQVVLVFADRLYLRTRPLHVLRHFLGVRVLRPLGVMQWPSDMQFWLLGVMGCVSVLLTGTDFESDASFGLASAGEKLIRAFGFLKFAPFLIPFRNSLSGMGDSIPKRTRVPMLALGVYFAALVVISFATNSRSTFADAIPTIVICILIGKSQGLLDFRRVPVSKLLLYAVVAVAVSVLLSRVALAMVVVRDYRNNADVSMLVRMTLEALMNSEWLESAKAKMETAVNVANYSETYVDSRFFGRFLLTKFHDNIIYYFSLMGPDQIAAYREFMLDRLGATLPDPFLRLLGITINKQDLIVSNGDYIIYLVDGWGLGGFKTGSMIGEVYGFFDWMFPLIVLISAILLFVFHDAFVMPTVSGRLVFSPLILLLIWNLVGTTAAFGLGAETVSQIPAGIVRGLPQNLLVYAIAIRLVRIISRLTGRT